MQCEATCLPAGAAGETITGGGFKSVLSTGSILSLAGLGGGVGPHIGGKFVVSGGVLRGQGPVVERDLIDHAVEGPVETV